MPDVMDLHGSGCRCGAVPKLEEIATYLGQRWRVRCDSCRKMTFSESSPVEALRAWEEAKARPSDCGGVRRCADTVKLTDRSAPQMLFVLVAPSGRLARVIAADSFDHAWEVATFWDDPTAPGTRKERGWRIWPCAVAWEQVP